MHKKLIWISILLGIIPGIQAQSIEIDVNLNVQHLLDTVTRFDRNKFVAIHADIDDSEWDEGWGDGAGPNFVDDLRDDFLNGYDVYMGRNTGTITWYQNNRIYEDPSRSGFAKPSDITAAGSTIKSSYAANTQYHGYEHRNDQIICTQLHPFYPDGQLIQDQAGTIPDWAFSTADSSGHPFGMASGEFYGRFIDAAFGTGGTTGKPKPKYAEVINEPLWHLVDYGDHEPEEVFRFHNAVADQVRLYNDDIAIGGFCTAFPDLEVDGFNQWEERWKLFMDMCGDNMDYWTIHLYDFPSINNGRELYRKGSNMEATFDMMEQYSYLSFAEVKPFMVSEYGAQMHDYFGAWSPYRDWLHLKSVNSMMMQFMERANIINKTVNFLPVKAIWGTYGVNDTYNHRLLVRENEPTSYTGDWVYSEMVKTYQLWSDVKGRRVDSRSENPDIMTDAYVDGNTAYLILNNLDFVSHDLNLNVFGTAGALDSVKIKHLYLNGATDSDSPALDVTVQGTAPASLTIAPEGTYIVQYYYASDITIEETMAESKYYAAEMLQAIAANTPIAFTINGVSTGAQGEAVLRLGVGRAHGLSLQPTVTVNNVEVDVPDNFRGDIQEDRSSFFGVLEIPVPYALLETDNDIRVEFSDNGGHVSSVALQVFDLSTVILRSWEVPVSGVTVTPETIATGIDQNRQLEAQVLPADAANQVVIWSSDATGIVTVDPLTGEITGVSEGAANVMATTAEGAFKDTCVVTVQTEIVPVPVDSIQLEPITLSLLVDDTYQLLASFYPVDATDDTLYWSSDQPTIASVDDNGLVTGEAEGSAVITVRSNDGDYTRTCSVTVATPVAASVSFAASYTEQTFDLGDPLEISIDYHAGTGNTVNADGLRVWLRLIENTTTWAVLGTVMPDIIVASAEAEGTESGTVTVSLPTTTVPSPTSELTDGNFYFLFVTLVTSGGDDLNSSQYPIVIENPTTDPDAITAVEADINSLFVFPNPVDDVIHIAGLSQGQNHIVIYNMMGAQMRQYSVQGSNVDELSVAELPEGVYLLMIQNEHQQRTIRFSVVR